MVIAGLLGACTGGEPSRIRIGAVGHADVAEVVEAAATVQARATAALRSPAGGTIARLYVADGDEVDKGDTLASITSPVAEEQLQQAREADRQTAVGGVPPGIDLSAFRRQADRTARQGFARARRAAEAIPNRRQRAKVLVEIARAQGQYAAAANAAQAAVSRLNAGLGSLSQAMTSIVAAQRVQTKAAVRAAERTVQALTIKAPFSGVASLGGPPQTTPDLSGLAGRLPGGLPTQLPAPQSQPEVISEGSPVSAGTAVVTITDVSELGLSADVDETDILLVRRGIQATVQLDAVQGAVYSATVTGIGVTPKQETGGGITYKVTLRLKRGTTSDGRPAPWPKPGMSAVADLKVRQAAGAVSVPSSAIVTSGNEATVWVVRDGRAQRQVIQLGAQGDARVQVLSGVAPGDRVVVRGADDVRQGQQVP